MPINLLADDMPQRTEKKAPINLLADEMPEEKEAYSKSLEMASFRIAKDLGDAIFERMKQIPSYIEKGKTEVPGLAKSLIKSPDFMSVANPVLQGIKPVYNLANKIMNPNQAAISPLQMQGMAGANEAINSLAQAPINTAKYGANRLNLIPQSVPNAMQKFMPEDTTEAIHRLFPEPNEPGEALGRGLARNIPNIAPSVEIASLLNPLKLTSGNIAKNILKAEKENIEKYSGSQGKYNQLQEKAAKRGITGEKIKPYLNDLKILEREMPTDEFEAISNLMKDKNLVNAQKAISQLGHRERKLVSKSNRGDILTDPEKDLLKSIRKTKDNIQKNMFKDKSGKIHEDLVKEHKNIQTGYRKEVIPYTKNKAIQEYKSGDKLADQLVKSLQSGKFPAQRGKFHKPLMLRREMGKHSLINKAVGLGSAGGLGALLYKMLS